MNIDVEEIYLPNGIYRYDIEIDTIGVPDVALIDTNFDTVDT